MNAKQLFHERIPALLHSHGALLTRDLVCSFKIGGEGGGEWTIDLRALPLSCAAGISPTSYITIATDAAHFESIVRDHRCLVDLYYRGAVEVSGDYRLYATLGDLIAFIASPPPANSGLSHLLAPFDTRRFLDQHWPNRHLVVHGSPSRLAGLTDIPELRSAHALLESWRGLAAVYPARGDGDYDAPAVPHREAAALFERGCPVRLDDMERHLPVLNVYLNRLVLDLGLPANVFARCMCYLTPAGAGASPHFDQNANFVVQLTGEKIWRMAPNKQVKNPTVWHNMGSSSTLTELSFQATGEFPTTMPEDAETINLVPGSVLFVPNAYWHATSSTGPSLSLNFTFDQPCWADLVCDALRRRLVWEPKWRELATNANAMLDAQHKRTAQAHLTGLLGEIPRFLGELRPAQIVNMMPKTGGNSLARQVDLTRPWLDLLAPEGRKAPTTS